MNARPEPRSRRRLRDTVWWRLTWTWGIYVLSVVLLMVTATARRWYWVALGVAVLTGAAWFVRNRLRDLRRIAPRRSLALASTATLVGVGMALLWFFGDEGPAGNWTGRLGFAGVVLAYFGVGQLLATLRTSTRPHWLSGRITLLACGVAAFVGLLVLTIDAPRWALVVFVAAVLASPVALMLTTDELLPRASGRTPDQRRYRLAVALAMVLVGLLWPAVLGVDGRYLFVGGTALVGLVGAIVSDTDVDILAVIIAVALVWSLAPRDAGTPDVMQITGGDRVLVAIGDSYISGEGAKRYVTGTNVRKKNECRRAPTAYPVRVLERLPENDPTMPDKVAFLACSGAQTRQLYGEAQYEADRPFGDEAYEIARADDDGTGPAVGSQLWHLESLLDRQGEDAVDVSLVVVSIGGNDAQFGTIGRVCVAPGDCSTLGGFWLDHLSVVERRLLDAYARIDEVVAGRAEVLVVPYPVPVAPDACSASLLADREHRFLHGFTTELDAVITRAARAAGFHVLADMQTSLEDESLRICDGTKAGDVGVNFLAANPVAGVLRQQVSPVNWFHNSLHPNERGHQQMAATLARWIRERPADPEASEGTRSLRRVLGAGGRLRHCAAFESGLPSCRSDSAVWTIAQATRLAWYSSPGVLLLLAGAWLLWVQVLAWSRQRH